MSTAVPPTAPPSSDGPDLSRLTADLDQRLAAADAALAEQFPGESATRQPVHTVYIPADRVHPGIVAEWGQQALAVLDEHRAAFAEVTGGDVALEQLVRDKLAREPIEDLRIDLEDGYGAHPDPDEDAAAASSAAALLADVDAGAAAPFHGIRFKSFEQPTRARGLRTLALFLQAATRDGRLPDGFVVTLPKVTSVDQVEAMVHAVGVLEPALGLPDKAVRFEIQIETPQSILGPDGSALVARMVHASEGRCTGLHYGTYDYSASCGIAAEFQSMEHPAADHAKAVMQVAAAGTGVRLSDGSTNVMPVGSPEAVRDAWALHHRLVRRSLERGYYQGWDLHPAQLPTRYAAVFAFYRGGFDSAAARLKAYVGQSDSGFMDEPATARALSDFVLRGLDCGAVSSEEVATATGLDVATLNELAKRV